MSEPEPIENEDEPSASAFMSLLNHYHDPDGTAHNDVEFEGLIGKITTSSGGATFEDGEEMGPTVEVRLYHAESGRLVQLLFAASAAIDLAARLAYAAGDAYEDDGQGDDDQGEGE